MNRETRTWTIVFVIGVVLLGIRAMVGGGLFGKAYVKATELEYSMVGTDDDGKDIWVEINSPAALDHDLTQFVGQDQRISWTKKEQSTQFAYAKALAADPNQTKYRFSLWRTIGIWAAAFFTLAIFSFLYKDNPFYKVAESVVVGVSAAFWMVVGFWNVLIPNLFAMIEPRLVNSWAMPGLDSGENHWSFLIPLVLGAMLLMRLAPKGAWISRWPLAFVIGTTAGIRLLGFLHGDFISQIRNSIVSLVVKTPQLAADGTAMLDAAGQPILGFDFWESLRSVILVVGVLSCVVYFFFSFEHKGLVGKTAKLGIWFLMITFGAAFGYTVMGRIALLAIRLEFLFDDWLWLIDPTGKRAADLISMIWAFTPMVT